MSIPTNCTLPVSDLVDLFEAGGRPFPVFFANPDCENNGQQWPSQLNYLSGDRVLNVRINLQDTPEACKLPPFPVAGGKDPVIIPDVLISNCPLPVFLSGIIPNNLNLYLETNDHPNIEARVTERGAFKMDSSNGTNNVVALTTGNTGSKNSSGTWGSVLTHGGSCSTQFNPPKYDSDKPSGTMNATNFSCGAQFWPSLSATQITLTNNLLGSPPTLQDADKTKWLSCSTSYEPDDTSGVCSQLDNDDGTAHLNNASNTLASEGEPDGIEGVHTPVVYTRCECLATYGEITTVLGFNDGYSVCDCAGRTAGPVPCTQKAATCYTGASIGATLKYITVTEKVPWSKKQLEYCTGTTFALAGIPVQRYGNGTPACDPLVEELCQNTAEIAANPSYQKLCTCILEEKRLKAQFAGLDLPVQCFSQVCNDLDPGVYKTVEMTKGCSARLCLQIVDINGSAIAAEGFQKMLCDGESYTISSSTSPSVSPVPSISVNPDQGSISLGIPFFVALGLILVMIVLLSAWGIRKAILRRSQKKLLKQQITQTLEKAL